MFHNKKSSPESTSPKKKFHLAKKQKIILFSLLGLSLVAGLIFFIKSRQKEEQINVQPLPQRKVEQVAEKIYSPLTGLEVTTEQSKLPLTALMVENSVDARPQSGLNHAGVIYEAIAEGGITRFATIYQDDLPAEIGPVRSLRPYYLDWLRPYSATIAHVGGSQRALKMVRDGTWKDMDQFANGKSFWRSKDRKAPHNVYTSKDLIDSYNQSKNNQLEDVTFFARKDDQKSAAPNATDIKLNISSTKYNVEFKYNPELNSYKRFQGGEAHLDKSGVQLEPKVVVAIVANYSIVQEDGSRSAYQTTGSGEAVVFQDGTATAATWQKADQASQLKLIDSTGTEIKLNRGQTWITALGTRNKLTYQ